MHVNTSSFRLGLLRSEQMKYGLLVLPVSEAHRIVARLGRDATLQPLDLAQLHHV